MNKQVLSPFDCDMCAMIEDITKQEIEVTNKGCGDCSNFMYEDVNGNGYCEAFKSEQRCGILRCQEYKPKGGRNDER